MSGVIADNYKLLQSLSRFDISLGFGDKSVEEVCAESGVDSGTLLAVFNVVSGYGAQPSSVAVPSLMGYLRNAHSYFLDYILPEIRTKLLMTIDCSSQSNVSFLILKYFDEYVSEVTKHMKYEEETVFSYVDSLLRGEPAKGFTIAQFAREHENTDHEGMDGKLAELKSIFIRYCPKTDNNNKLNSVLFDLFNCEDDLASHSVVEEKLFVPAVRLLEEHVRRNPRKGAKADEESTELSDREREIIVCVAKGMLNKEIADHLCIALNTVITHRRNIARKLGIHTPAGLAIYAISNKLINIDEARA